MTQANLMASTILAAGLAALFPSVVVAQDGEMQAAAAESSEQENATGAVNVLRNEIVVTARRKSDAERLQEVPVSVTAFSGDQLEARFASNARDITAYVPNAQAWEPTSFPGYVNFFIRGVGVSGTVLSDDPAVGVFVDGAYMGISAGITTDFFDVESVEVLRGPQGTLFGRNVTGGAVLINTRKPTETFEGRVRGIIGSDDRREIAASLSGPIVDGKLLGKISYFHKERGDIWENIGGGDDLGEQNQDVLRAALTWIPSDSITATLTGEIGDANNDAQPLWAIENSGFRTLSAAAGAATIQEFQANLTDPTIIQAPLPSDGRDVISNGIIGTPSTEWRSANLTVDFELGAGELKSITALRSFEQDGLAQDNDGTSRSFFDTDQTAIDQEQFSQEFVYNVALGDRFDLTAGLYYFDQSYDFQEHRIVQPWFRAAAVGDFPDYLGGGVPGAVWAALTGDSGPLVGFDDWFTESSTDHTVYGAFLQSDIALTDAFYLTVGGRYSHEEKSARINQYLAPGCGGSPGDSLQTCADSPNTFVGKETWKNFTPKVGLQYKPNQDAQLYASWSRGFRSGGFNVRQTAAVTPGPYDEETVDAYEIGFKVDLADGRIRLNGAVFYNDYTDLQTTVIAGDGTQSVSNQGRAEISGAELEATLLIIDNLLLQANVGYTDAKLKETGNVSTEGNQLQFVPEWQGGATLVYDIPISIGTITLLGSYSYTDESPSDNANLGPFSESYSLVDASVSLSLDNGVKITAFGRNLTDEFAGGQTVFAPGLAALQSPPTQPRNWGLEVQFDF